MNLKNKLETIKESYSTLQKAQILHVTEGEFKLAMEVNNTQQASNRTMRLVNKYSDTIRNHHEALRRVGKLSVLINNKLNAFMHAIEDHFLHISIKDILRGKLDLHFIHHSDIFISFICNRRLWNLWE
ncbi:unnamed protein product [Adineta steineri]|uniref:Uncharacterized protein n=1 Tax=Adineta steineri TaxID=433720 RepID=A0A815C794_9BILA|nr:unnamed protein product [Adineta steineri]CAF1282203.1 unnamed protein product [Adineta steineri]CAF1564218.1 unnamed protein product [Adineta steineri]CAF1564971.1 unnamed protein product [Adineta steineri]